MPSARAYQVESGAALNFPNLSVLHGATGFSVVRFNVLTGGTLSLPALTSIPDGAVQVLASDPNSVVDLSALATFADNTGGGNSFLEARGWRACQNPGADRAAVCQFDG